MSFELLRHDFTEAFRRRAALRYFGWDDIRMQYRRTFLGPIWVMLGTCGWIFGMAFVLSALFNQKLIDFLPYTAMGMFVWGFIVLPLTDGCSVFISAAGLINSMRLPLFFHAARTLLRYVFLYAHYLLIGMFLLTVTGHPPGMIALLAIPGMVIQFFTVFGLLLTMGIVNARYRDLAPISTVLCQLLPMMTPIAWKREMLQKNVWLADYNPFYHLIQIVRAPFLGDMPSENSYLISLGVMVLSVSVGLLLYSRARYKLIFWI